MPTTLANTSATVRVPAGDTTASTADSLRCASLEASRIPTDSSSRSVPVTTAMAAMATIAHMHGQAAQQCSAARGERFAGMPCGGSVRGRPPPHRQSDCLGRCRPWGASLFWRRLGRQRRSPADDSPQPAKFRDGRCTPRGPRLSPPTPAMNVGSELDFARWSAWAAGRQSPAPLPAAAARLLASAAAAKRQPVVGFHALQVLDVLVLCRRFLVLHARQGRDNGMGRPPAKARQPAAP